MTINEYMNFCRTTAIYPLANSGDVQELMYLALGLAGEAGEVANKVKKLYRDGDALHKRSAIAGEVGDVLWYLVRIIDALELDPELLMINNRTKLESRQERGALGGNGDNR